MASVLGWCFSGAGFTDELRAAERDEQVVCVSLDRLYTRGDEPAFVGRCTIVGVTVITVRQSAAEIAALERRLSETERNPAAHVDALRAALAHPCSQHAFPQPQLWAELARALGGLGDYDSAIEAIEAGIEHGAWARPHPRADVAEWHLLAGRRDQAETVYATLREQSPRDVWLYNHAGLAYADVGDHATAVRWLTEGLRVALADGDPERLASQLAELRTRSLEELGADPDDELTRAAAAAPRQPATHGPMPPRPAPPAPCSHCGYDPDRERPAGERQPGTPGPPDAAATRLPRVGSEVQQLGLLAVAWFPRDQWPRAIELWPDLLEDRPADPDAYSHATEAHVKAIRDVAFAPVPLAIAPIRLDAYLAYCEAHGHDSATGDSRASFASELARTGDAVPWPPGRNDPCWCGSGRKYKRCCGPVPPADFTEQ
ncbi:MAG: SEC-C metal-binding domain-containing protein [Pseudonocardiaceae bacterium]